MNLEVMELSNGTMELMKILSVLLPFALKEKKKANVKVNTSESSVHPSAVRQKRKSEKTLSQPK